MPIELTPLNLPKLSLCRSPPVKVINSWCMYDWAILGIQPCNNIYHFPGLLRGHYQKGQTPDNEVEFLGRKFVNTALYNYALGAAFIVVAFISPILTSIADYCGNKRNFMRLFCTMGAIFCTLLYFFAPAPQPDGSAILSIEPYYRYSLYGVRLYRLLVQY